MSAALPGSRRFTLLHGMHLCVYVGKEEMDKSQISHLAMIHTFIKNQLLMLNPIRYVITNKTSLIFISKWFLFRTRV